MQFKISTPRVNGNRIDGCLPFHDCLDEVVDLDGPEGRRTRGKPLDFLFVLDLLSNGRVAKSHPVEGLAATRPFCFTTGDTTL